MPVSCHFRGCKAMLSRIVSGAITREIPLPLTLQLNFHIVIFLHFCDWLSVFAYLPGYHSSLGRFTQGPQRWYCGDCYCRILQTGCPSCRPTNSIKALNTEYWNFIWHVTYVHKPKIMNKLQCPEIFLSFQTIRSCGTDHISKFQCHSTELD